MQYYFYERYNKSEGTSKLIELTPKKIELWPPVGTPFLWGKQSNYSKYYSTFTRNWTWYGSGSLYSPPPLPFNSTLILSPHLYSTPRHSIPLQSSSPLFSPPLFFTLLLFHSIQLHSSSLHFTPRHSTLQNRKALNVVDSTPLNCTLLTLYPTHLPMIAHKLTYSLYPFLVNYEACLW